jgi:hypothetical protein
VLSLDARVEQFQLQQEAQLRPPGHPVIDLEPAEPFRRHGSSLLAKTGLGTGAGRDRIERPAVDIDLPGPVSEERARRPSLLLAPRFAGHWRKLARPCDR